MENDSGDVVTADSLGQVPQSASWVRGDPVAGRVVIRSLGAW